MCLDPFAYGLREHSLFREPVRIDTHRMVARPTPAAWKTELKERQVQVVPLVDDLRGKYRAGWCTYATDFPDLPEVEFFCGGINIKTPTAAALWRQGHLFHFGFEQSPAELNETGRALLLNAIAYISRFTEDRPIAITPSVFAGPAPRPRSILMRAMADRDFEPEGLTYWLSASAMKAIRTKSRKACRAWLDENGDYLRATPPGTLEVDEQAKSFGVPPARIEFLDKAVAALDAGGEPAQRAILLLNRYAPAGPVAGSGADWRGWWTENRDYLFFSEAGGYRWYVDPLAKKRGVPSRNLRGPARATVPDS